MELKPPYSIVYIEKDCKDYPITKKILNQIPHAKEIYIQDYKQVFNKPNQNFQIQKKSPKLIIAKKKDNFLYKGSDLAPNFGEENFYYNALVLNCPFNCYYCYLQGMYSSSNLVVFVNIEDFFQETKKTLENLNRLYLCLSYDTDLLALESWLGYCKLWIDFARDKPNLILELRTKSVNVKPLELIEPIPNMVLAWTLSPQEIIEKYEKKTPSLQSRLKAIELVHNQGWLTRICLDPILYVPNWKEIYGNFLSDDRVQKVLSLAKEISIGTFRINKNYMERMVKLHPGLDIFHAPMVQENDSIEYPKNIQKEIIQFINEKIKASKCFFLTGQSLLKKERDPVVK